MTEFFKLFNGGTSAGVEKAWEKRKSAFNHMADAKTHQTNASDYASKGKLSEASDESLAATHSANNSEMEAHKTGLKNDFDYAATAHEKAARAHGEVASNQSAGGLAHKDFFATHSDRAEKLRRQDGVA